MRPEQKAPEVPDEETALHCIVEYLTKGQKGEDSRYGYSFHVNNPIDRYLRSVGMTGELSHFSYGVSGPFLSAC